MLILVRKKKSIGLTVMGDDKLVFSNEPQALYEGYVMEFLRIYEIPINNRIKKKIIHRMQNQVIQVADTMEVNKILILNE